MSKRLFSCSNSATEELDYYADLMSDNNIQYYITPGSAFGISKPSFWIKEDEDFKKAKELFVSHQETYAQLAREKYQQESGYNPNASGKEYYKFLLRHLYQRRFTLPWIFLGFLLVYLYFSSFFKSFFSLG